jgi:hypothetical protein
MFGFTIAAVGQSLYRIQQSTDAYRYDEETV